MRRGAAGRTPAERQPANDRDLEIDAHPHAPHTKEESILSETANVSGKNGKRAP